jgi:predicted dehydrogenase
MTRRHLLATATAAATLPTFSQATPAKYRVAIIGHTGRGNYGHGLDTMWQSLPQTQVVAIADADSKGLAAAQAKLKIDRAYSDYTAMLTEVKPDLVAIGPRHIDQHHAMVLTAAAAGARGIYMEKPFCRSPQEADEIIAACAKSNTHLALAHRNRYHPALQACQKLIAEGAIGRLLEVRCRGKEDTRGGTLDLWVLGCHLFNLATVFMGAPKACTASLYQNGHPVTKAHVIEGAEGIGALAGNEVHARFEMENGLPLFFDSVQNAGTRDAGFGLQLIGNEGVIDLRIDAEPLNHLRRGSPFNPRTASQPWQPIHSDGLSPKEPLVNLGKDISSHATAGRDLIAAIEENRPPLCDAEAGRTTIEMICAILESHRQASQTISFPLKTRQNPLTLL